MRRLRKLSVAVAASALVLTGCATEDDEPTAGADSSESPTTEESVCETAEGDGPKIGVAYDVGGRGDLSFNDSAFAGIEQAVADLDATCQEAEAGVDEKEQDREERLRLLAEAGFDPVIAVGYIYSPAARTVAQEFPDTSFAVVDGFSSLDFTNNPDGDFKPLPNLADLTFAEHEGSFLVGVAAALTTKTKNVGFLGGLVGPLIEKFEAGFKAGIKAVDPSIKVQTEYLSQNSSQQGFENPAGGKTAATGMYENGADVVYHAAGKSGLGLFDAVVEAGEGNYAIGVDSDQYLTADEEQKPYILTSMLKRIDTAIIEYLTAFDEGKAPTGFVTYDLKGDGIGYSTSNEEAIGGITDQIDAYARKIESGEIKVPDTVK